MAEPMSDKYYEEKFEFPFWKLIKQRAEEKDISYIQASEELIPEYAKNIKYGDTEFEEASVQEGAKEIAEWAEKGNKEML